MSSTGSVLAIAGCKGGVGKTTTAINLGTAACLNDRSALLVETDLAMANVCDFLNLDFNPERDPSLHDVLADGRPIDSAVYDAPDGLRVLPSGATIDGFANTDLNRLGTVVSLVREHYDLVLLDTPAGISRETLYPMVLSDEVVLVSTPRVSAIRDTMKTLELVERVGGSTAGLVLTHTGTGNAPPDERLADFLGVELLGSIPEDAAVSTAQDSGRAVVAASPSALAAKAYDRTFDRLEDRVPGSSSDVINTTS